MERFSTGQRVDVVAENHPLRGRRGTVRNLNVGNRGASVRIDGGVPAELETVVDGESVPGVTVLFPDQCREVR